MVILSSTLFTPATDFTMFSASVRNSCEGTVPVKVAVPSCTQMPKSSGRSVLDAINFELISSATALSARWEGEALVCVAFAAGGGVASCARSWALNKPTPAATTASPRLRPRRAWLRRKENGEPKQGVGPSIVKDLSLIGHIFSFYADAKPAKKLLGKSNVTGAPAEFATIYSELDS
jgi:hypothetical protein